MKRLEITPNVDVRKGWTWLSGKDVSRASENHYCAESSAARMSSLCFVAHTPKKRSPSHRACLSAAMGPTLGSETRLELPSMQRKVVSFRAASF